MNDERTRAAVERPRILIVEDDRQIAEMLRDSLVEQGMDAEFAGDGAAMDAKMRVMPFDLVVLDVMLPGEDGLSLCRRLRVGGGIPILMLTSLSTDIDRIVGLEIGADDYVTKPFVLRELLARIKGLLRRSALSAQREVRPAHRLLRFDGWRIDPARRQVHDPDQARIAMTTHEFDLLLAFCRNAGRVLTREQLLAVTHAGLAGPIERSIDVHISRLRQKIEKDPRDPLLIKTVRLGGYVFTAQVEEADV
ncbi:two-component system OmpR family response regulator [Rhizobium sp. BK196]|uniref:response regulator n=1 Tax=unclassified Rhizobium TaxID=2613769 RepID=UPI00161EBE0B|nr:MULTISPECIES: response regulator transcription factor [unclassified Rhizobium]MBB3312430.1 two-component system OmpR family response regulator [Rhizobium sp. BK196]MBB3463240.1 two-component system OmpR family response regulator [Rhizobium sp. BK377]